MWGVAERCKEPVRPCGKGERGKGKEARSTAQGRRWQGRGFCVEPLPTSVPCATLFLRRMKEIRFPAFISAKSDAASDRQKTPDTWFGARSILISA